MGCSAAVVVSVSLVDCFSESFSESLSFCEDAPSSTSTSCARGDEVTQEVQMNVMRSKKEILRRFVDCLPSALPNADGGLSLPDGELLPFPLVLLRRGRVLTGTDIEEAVQELASLLPTCLVSDGGGVLGAIDESV